MPQVRHALSFRPGKPIYEIGAPGLAWRVEHGSVRLDGLIRIMASDDAAQRVVLPTRQDIADITALRLETVSRIIKRLERDGLLQPVRIDGVHATRSFAVDFRRLAT